MSSCYASCKNANVVAAMSHLASKYAIRGARDIAGAARGVKGAARWR